ncbi:MAG: VanZ family protein [Actinomycetes bacterium]
MRDVRRVAMLLMAAYLLTVAWIVFWPSAEHASASVAWMTDLVRSVGAPAWVSRLVVEFCANVALFLPLTFLGSFLIPDWSWQRWLLVGFCVSAVIELGQLVLLPDRSARWYDLAANTLGALVGAILVLPARERLLPNR